MIVKTYGSCIYGINATTITVEVNVDAGVNFYLVGLPDSAIKESEQRIDLTKRMHHAVCLLSDVDPKENPYEEIFNNTKKVNNVNV